MARRVLRLLHITDSHLHAAAQSRMRGVRTADTFAAVMDHAMQHADPPDAILATGDLVQDETRAGYERLRDTLAPLGLPVYCVPGNHDAPTAMAEILSGEPFQICGEVVRDNWCLILLNSYTLGDDGGRLAKTEIARLRQILVDTQADHCLVCVHHHPVPMGSRWLDGVALRNGDEMLEIIDAAAQVRGVLWGHVHQASDRQRQNVRMMSTPSTCVQWLPNSDSFAVDSRPPGYRWLDLNENGRIDSRVVWID